MKFFNASGYLALFFGVLATIFTFENIILALPCAIFGYIFSIIYVFIKTKREIKTGLFNHGIVGMLLSSVPVIVLLYFIFFASPK